MISQRLLEKAAKVLPGCKTLKDAEEHLGGEWSEFTKARDVKAAAITWGLFDACKNRPKCDSLPMGAVYFDYSEAYEAMLKMGLREVPG